MSYRGRIGGRLALDHGSACSELWARGWLHVAMGSFPWWRDLRAYNGIPVGKHNSYPLLALAGGWYVLSARNRASCPGNM